MSVKIEAAITRSSRTNNAPLDEIIELGRKALRQRRSDELAHDLLALDGVRLPLKRRGAN